MPLVSWKTHLIPKKVTGPVKVSLIKKQWNIKSLYYKQARSLLKLLPHLETSTCLVFAIDLQGVTTDNSGEKNTLFFPSIASPIAFITTLRASTSTDRKL